MLAIIAASLVTDPSLALAQKNGCEPPLPSWCETANSTPDALLAECQRIKSEVRKVLANSLTALACEARELGVMMAENDGPRFKPHPVTGAVCPYYDGSSAAAMTEDVSLNSKDFAQFEDCQERTWSAVQNGIASPAEVNALILKCWGEIRRAAAENMQPAEQEPNTLPACLQAVGDLLDKQYSIEQSTEQAGWWSVGIVPRIGNNWLHERSRDIACAGYREIRPLLLKACLADDYLNRSRRADAHNRVMCLNRGKFARQPQR